MHFVLPSIQGSRLVGFTGFQVSLRNEREYRKAVAITQ
jgi:hypothetical protein